jgi:hypothetical protein
MTSQWLLYYIFWINHFLLNAWFFILFEISTLKFYISMFCICNLECNSTYLLNMSTTYQILKFCSFDICVFNY